MALSVETEQRGERREGPLSTAGGRRQEWGEEGGLSRSPLPWLCQGLARYVCGETAGQVDESCRVSLPVCPGPSFLGLRFCGPENRPGVGWVGRC